MRSRDFIVRFNLHQDFAAILRRIVAVVVYGEIFADLGIYVV